MFLDVYDMHGDSLLDQAATGMTNLGEILNFETKNQSIL